MMDYFVLSWKWDSKKLMTKSSSHWMQRSISSTTLKCVCISAFFYIPAGFPQHLFATPLDSGEIRDVPVIAIPRADLILTVLYCSGVGKGVCTL